MVKFDETLEYVAPGQDLRRAKILAGPKDGSRKNVALCISVYGPGMAAPFHAHKGEETIYVTHGKAVFSTKTEDAEATPGTVPCLEPGEEHKLHNVGRQTLEFIFVYTPPGDEAITTNSIPLPKVK